MTTSEIQAATPEQLVEDNDRRESGALLYRGKVTIRGKRRRIECTVMPWPRAEGRLPQLVRVTAK